MENELKKIQEDLEELKSEVKKLNSNGVDKKWFVLLLTLVTAILAGVNIYIEKNINKTLIQETKRSEIFGESGAKERVAFLKNSKAKLIVLDNAFEEYCLIGQDSITQNKVVNAASDFTSYLDKSIVEKELNEDLQEYIEYVVDELFNIYEKDLSDISRKNIYQNSHNHFEQVDNLLEKRINELLGE